VVEVGQLQRLVERLRGTLSQRGDSGAGQRVGKPPAEGDGAFVDHRHSIIEDTRACGRAVAQAGEAVLEQVAPVRAGMAGIELRRPCPRLSRRIVTKLLLILFEPPAVAQVHKQVVVLELIDEVVVGVEGDTSFRAQQVEEPCPRHDPGLIGVLGAVSLELGNQFISGQTGIRIELHIEVLTLEPGTNLVEWSGHGWLPIVVSARVRGLVGLLWAG